MALVAGLFFTGWSTSCAQDKYMQVTSDSVLAFRLAMSDHSFIEIDTVISNASWRTLNSKRSFLLGFASGTVLSTGAWLSWYALRSPGYWNPNAAVTFSIASVGLAGNILVFAYAKDAKARRQSLWALLPAYFVGQLIFGGMLILGEEF